MGTYDPQAPLAGLSDHSLVKIFSYVIVNDPIVVTSKNFKSDAFKSSFHFNFVSKYMPGLTGKGGEGRRVGSIYLGELGMHILKSAALIKVNMQDLKLANLKRLLDALKTYSSLSDFELDGNGEPQSRGISIRHRTTYRFPTEHKSLVKFDEYLNTLCAAKTLNMRHLVIHIEDLAPVNGFIQAARFRDTTEGQVDACFQALWGKIWGEINQLQNPGS